MNDMELRKKLLAWVERTIEDTGHANGTIHRYIERDEFQSMLDSLHQTLLSIQPSPAPSSPLSQLFTHTPRGDPNDE